MVFGAHPDDERVGEERVEFVDDDIDCFVVFAGEQDCFVMIDSVCDDVEDDL